MTRLSSSLKVLLYLLGAAVGALFIGYLNWLVIRGWFAGQGPANLGSIEVSYVSMGRFLVDYGLPGPLAGQASWAPFWYLGFPFYLFYTPLLPVLEWLLAIRWGMHLWEAYRLVTGWAYILAPVSVFLLGWVLSRRWIGGLVAGVAYSIGPTLFYFLFREVAADRFSPPAGGFLDPRRFTILVRWGEGPHLLSLVFLPLVGAFFVLSLRQRSIGFLFLGSLAFVLTALANALGMMGSLILVAVIGFARYAQRAREHTQIAKWTVLFLLASLGLSAFWYNPSFIKNFFGEGGNAAGIYLSLFPWGWLAAILGAGLLYLVCGKLLRDLGVAASLIWFLVLFSVVYYYYASSDVAALRVELLPQALRYMTQVDMAFSVLVGTIVGWLVKTSGRRWNIAEILLPLFLALPLTYGVVYIQPFLPISLEASSKVVDLSTQREQVIAEWLREHVDPRRGERVFLPGNYGFYLNWFSDVWQHRGALYQAASHFWPDHIHYQLVNGEDREVAQAWLVAINAKYAVITGPGSSELYREVRNLERFDNLTAVYEERGDIIYEVPLVRSSPVKPVATAKLPELAAPRKADDAEALIAYADWVEKSSLNEAEFQMIDQDHYLLSGRLDAGEALLVQMTADPGWRALLRRPGGRLTRIRTGKDPLGFLLLFPEETGEFEIILTHGASFWQWFGYLTSGMTLLGLGWLGLRSIRKASS